MTMIALPPSIQQFIEAATVCGNMYLPFHYPVLNEVEGYQSGFRIHGITGQDLTGSRPGQWQPGWYVVVLNGFDDPFFVDITEEKIGFPLYYAPLGAGRWEPATVVPAIGLMSRLLELCKTTPEDQLYSTLIQWSNAGQHQLNLENPFWKELFDSLQQEKINH